MNYYYEKICRESNMDESQIKEIRIIFDDDRHRLKARQRYLDEHGLSVISIYDNSETTAEILDIPDTNCDVEEEALHNIEMEKLRYLLDNLDSEEKEIVLNYFDKSVNFSAFAKQKGVSRDSLIRTAKRIFKKLKEEMMEEF